LVGNRLVIFPTKFNRYTHTYTHTHTCSDLFSNFYAATVASHAKLHIKFLLIKPKLKFLTQEAKQTQIIS